MSHNVPTNTPKSLAVKDFGSDVSKCRVQHRRMDLGLGEILRHFEEHFGKTATKILLGVVGFAVLGGCLHLIWDNIVKPIYAGAHWFLTETHLQFPSGNVVLASIITGLSAALIFYFAFKLISSSINARMIKLMAELSEVIDKSKEAGLQANVKIQELKEGKTVIGRQSIGHNLASMFDVLVDG